MDPGNSLAWNSYRVDYFDITFLTTWLDVFIAKKESVGKVLAFVEWVVALFGCRNYLAMARNLPQNFRQYFSSSLLWYSFLQKMLHSHWKVSFHRLAHCCAIFLWATNYSWVTFQLICHWRILSGVNLKCAGWSPDVKSRKGQSSRNQQSFPADLANCLFLLPGNIRRTTWNFVFVIYIYICCDKQFFF